MSCDPLLQIAPTSEVTAGDAQTALYEQQRVAMLRLGYLLTGSPVVAEELFHDAFAQVVQRWASIETPGGYLRTALVNGARSWGRKRRRLPAPPLSDQLAIDADAIAVREVLARLGHHEREVLVLRYYGGLTDSQIAETVERPIGTSSRSCIEGFAG